jgi:hypothetical protein
MAQARACLPSSPPDAGLRRTLPDASPDTESAWTAADDNLAPRCWGQCHVSRPCGRQPADARGGQSLGLRDISLRHGGATSARTKSLSFEQVLTTRQMGLTLDAGDGTCQRFTVVRARSGQPYFAYLWRASGGYPWTPAQAVEVPAYGLHNTGKVIFLKACWDGCTAASPRV